MNPYNFPPSFHYRSYRHGEFLPQSLILGAYFIGDYLALGLAEPPYGAQWVRFGPDALLIDRRTGEVLDTVYGVYDDGVAPPPPPPSGPPEDKLFDNWNTDACDFTDTAVLTLNRPVTLDRLDLWLNWGSGETSVNYRVLLDGQDYGQGTLQRADCDPYQPAWCTATDAPGADLDPGRYVIQIDHSALCRNRGSYGEGFVRAWGYWR